MLATTGSNRTSVSLDQIPEDLQHAFIAIEDERFYEHNGIDMKGIFRAVAITFSKVASLKVLQLSLSSY